MIPHSRPHVSEDDVEAVARVVRRGQLAQGPEVEAFEREVAERVGAPAGAAVASGTVALELALRALGIGPDAEVVVPSYACDAFHHAVTRCGAQPVLADWSRHGRRRAFAVGGILMIKLAPAQRSRQGRGSNGSL